MASKYHRPVRFIRHSIETPTLTFHTLVYRNIHQLLTQNTYITSTYIAEKYYVVNSVISQGGGYKGLPMQSAVAEKLGKRDCV
ncbi:hypothetical protein EON63_15370 [archaeon]|nr:MAG: hypothetical protein EON63_15370 [archaeon]